jgi:hypothetical protein
MVNYSRLKEFREFVSFPVLFVFVYLFLVCSTFDGITINPALISTFNIILKLTLIDPELASNIVYVLEEKSSILLFLFLFYFLLSAFSFFWMMLCSLTIGRVKDNGEYNSEYVVENNHHILTAFHYISNLRAHDLFSNLIIALGAYFITFSALHFVLVIIFLIPIEIINWLYPSMKWRYLIAWESVVMIVISSTVALYAGFTSYPKRELVGSGGSTPVS